MYVGVRNQLHLGHVFHSIQNPVLSNSPIELGIPIGSVELHLEKTQQKVSTLGYCHPLPF